MDKLKRYKGITLISLVVTIVVLIIIAGISISMILSNEGIFNKAKIATEETRKQTATEIMNLKITNIQISSYTENQQLPNLQYISDKLCEDNDMEYVVLKEKEQASLTKITVGSTDSILTKLKEYPYVFEINNQLQLASIDGIKVATVPANDSDSIVSMTKAELKELIDLEISNLSQEKLHVNSISTDNITYNTTYIDNTSSSTWVTIKKYGNIVMINYSVLIKKDIPNSETTLFSGIPNPSTEVKFTGTTTWSDVYTTRSRLNGSNVNLFWVGKTVQSYSSKNTIEGSIIYISNN